MINRNSNSFGKLLQLTKKRPVIGLVEVALISSILTVSEYKYAGVATLRGSPFRSLIVLNITNAALDGRSNQH